MSRRRLKNTTPRSTLAKCAKTEWWLSHMIPMMAKLTM